MNLLLKKGVNLFFFDKFLLSADTFIQKPNLSVANLGIGNPRLLPQVVIFNKQQPLYTKTKTIKVSILVIAKMTSAQVLIITGTLRFTIFSYTKEIIVFNRTQNVNYNWQYNNNFVGTCSFNLYVSLPKPVSFIGINFGITVNYNIHINLSSSGASIGQEYYQSTFQSKTYTTLSTDASAAIRVLTKQGRVFIQGTLLNVSTNPKLILKYYYIKRILNVKVIWPFNLQPFSFTWGFFYRTLNWKGQWSDKKIISQWTVSNPNSKQYQILNIQKNYKF